MSEYLNIAFLNGSLVLIENFKRLYNIHMCNSFCMYTSIMPSMTRRDS